MAFQVFWWPGEAGFCMDGVIEVEDVGRQINREQNAEKPALKSKKEDGCLDE